MEAKRDSWEFVGSFGNLTREMLAAILDQSIDCIKILDPAGRLDFMNRNGLCAMEIDDFAMVAGKPWPQLWPTQARADVEASVAAAQGGSITRFEAFCPTAKGTPKWWDVSVVPVRDARDALFAILSVSRDVTAHHTSLEGLETMAHEMRHRLRNAYAVSAAITAASGRENAPHRDFAEQLAQRLNSLSQVQGSLIEPPGDARLPAVIDRIVGAFDPNGCVSTSEVPDVALGEQAVRLLALVLGELAANSLKHGALGRAATIDIVVTVEDGRLRLVWRERLASLSKPQSAPSEGSGLRLMERIARAHGGAFAARFGKDGLEAHLEGPVDR